MVNNTMNEILKKYPWIAEDNAKLIISPDSDGFLSALLYLNYFNARVVGYYDCKVMLCEKDVDPRDCIFLDLDIFCKDMKSVGHHMVCFDKNRKPDNWNHYDNFIQLNNLREFDCRHDFQRKYPFATIHFLLSLLENVNHKDIRISPDAIVPLLFSDGVCNNLFGYPENCLDWFKWLKADDPNSLLFDVFYKQIPFSTVMGKMDSFFKERDRFNSSCYYDLSTGGIIEKKRSRSGHHMIITLSNGEPVNIVPNTDGTYDVLESEANRVLGFIELMAGLMGWQSYKNKWIFENLRLFKFSKDSYSIGSKTKLNASSYKKMVEGDCFSMAITGGTTIEFTRDTNHYYRS